MPQKPDAQRKVELSGKKRDRSPSASPRVYSVRHSPGLGAAVAPRSKSPIVSPMLPAALDEGAPPPLLSVPQSSLPLFTDPEIHFQLEADRARTTIMPRDVANLMLWSLPTTTPLVDSPKWFFLKNRSHVAGCVTIFCNGVSYDAIMNTGAGVAVAEGRAWNEDLCALLLEPVRRGTCFAHKNSVAHAPLWVPSQNNRLEMDLFFRQESTRHMLAATRKTSGEQKQKSLIERAREVAGAAPTEPSKAAEVSLAEPVKPPSSIGDEMPSLLVDVDVLKEFALYHTRDADALRELQFTLEAPEDEVHRWRSPSGVSGELRVFGFDCEMVQVANGVSALARATLVDARTAEVVLDILVKPLEPVVDYVTRFSGITEAMLSCVTTTLSDAQKALLHHITEDAFVIGHSLENDFKACKLLPRCWILDTAHMYPHPGGLPYKNALRFLAQHYLKRMIQGGEHDSVEDAIVCSHLVGLKVKHGPSFGLTSRVNVINMIPSHRVNDASQSEAARNSSPLIHVALVDDPTTLRMISGCGAHCSPITSHGDIDAARKAQKFLSKQRSKEDAFFLWLHLRDCDVDIASGGAAAEAQTQKARDMNDRVMGVIKACPDWSMVTVIAANCQQGNGNRLSKAHGMVFSFIKNSAARGPAAANECAQS